MIIMMVILMTKMAKIHTNITIFSAKMCHFLGLLTQKNHSIDVSVTKLMQKRQEYKKMRNWKEADIIRKKIENRGYQILDGKRSSKIIKKM